MDMIRPNIQSVKDIAAKIANLLNGLFYNSSFSRTEKKGIVFKLPSLALNFHCVWFYFRGPESIVISPIDGTAFVTVQPGTITSESDQITFSNRSLVELDRVSFHDGMDQKYTERVATYALV